MGHLIANRVLYWITDYALTRVYIYKTIPGTRCLRINSGAFYNVQSFLGRDNGFGGDGRLLHVVALQQAGGGDGDGVTGEVVAKCHLESGCAS
jgi:hypothetical protein